MNVSDPRISSCCASPAPPSPVGPFQVRVLREWVRNATKCTGTRPASSRKEDAPEELGVLLFYYAVILEVIL